MPHATQAYEKMGSLLHYLHKNAQVENKQLEFTTSLGRVFHSAIVLGKNENLSVYYGHWDLLFKNMTATCK